MALRSCSRRKSRSAWDGYPFFILLVSLRLGGGSFLRISIGTRAGAAVGCDKARGGTGWGASSGRD